MGSIRIIHDEWVEKQTGRVTNISGKHLAHSRSESGREDLLSYHLQDVANRAAEFAAAFHASEEARLSGLLHDLGKYGCLFQRRLEGKERGIDHWSLGAWAVLMRYKNQGIASALAIQGHHIGLQQASGDALRLLSPKSLQNYHPLGLRLSDTDVNMLVQNLDEDGVILPDPDNSCGSLYSGLQALPAAAMLDVRMLFSALVDADFIETEAHFQANPDGSKSYRKAGPSLEEKRALSFLMFYIEELAAKSNSAISVNQLRADLLDACLEAADSPQGVFTLTAPTGTGKTLSMLAFALKHAKKHNLRRIVMVIPYLSIIEQTALEYRKVYIEKFDAEYLDRYILEHHSLVGTHAIGRRFDERETDMEDESFRRTRLLAENWDVPIVITTSVQFLQSLFANRPSACRKLHNLAKSVILFDEVQTLPVSLAVPTLATLSRLAERYRATVVFSTATQPAFAHLDDYVRKYCVNGWNPLEIVPRGLSLFGRAKRTTVEWPTALDSPTPWLELAEQLSTCEQALCVVNLKRHALHLLSELHERNIGHLFHLSTSMCPAHRQAVLEEVRGRLDPQTSRLCLLISTQCIEAGVDVDFPVVYRAFGPLDAIAQAAGRCNRNGRSETGRVVVFMPEEEAYPDGAYRQAAATTRILFIKYGSRGMDISDPCLFDEYYRELYSLIRPEDWNEEIHEAIMRQDFVEVAQLYRIIPKDTINVLVPYNPAIFQRLADKVRKDGLTRRWVSSARPHTIGLFRPKPDDPVWTYLDPVPVGKGTFSEEWFIYINEEHYKPLTGLVPPSSMECLIA